MNSDDTTDETIRRMERQLDIFNQQRTEVAPMEIDNKDIYDAILKLTAAVDSLVTKVGNAPAASSGGGGGGGDDLIKRTETVVSAGIVTKQKAAGGTYNTFEITFAKQFDNGPLTRTLYPKSKLIAAFEGKEGQEVTYYEKQKVLASGAKVYDIVSVE
jgi:hypothetical protein